MSVTVHRADFPKLDAAAAREAKRWHLQPGMQDGRPVGMWKRIQITFKIEDVADETRAAANSSDRI
jgi:hypothetical protein